MSAEEKMFNKLDRIFIEKMKHRSIPALRIALAIVFIWFGALKVFDVSPVKDLIETTYSFLPEPAFMIFLGVWEIIIGLGLLFRRFLRVTLFLLWFQMAGTIFALFLAPSLFFNLGNPLLLTTEGEFVVKNLALIAAGFVIGGHEVKPKSGENVV